MATIKPELQSSREKLHDELNLLLQQLAAQQKIVKLPTAQAEVGLRAGEAVEALAVWAAQRRFRLQIAEKMRDVHSPLVFNADAIK
jgi:glycerol dehydrogenase-like iron-containing ADH family enzyme